MAIAELQPRFVDPAEVDEVILATCAASDSANRPRRGAPRRIPQAFRCHRASQLRLGMEAIVQATSGSPAGTPT